METGEGDHVGAELAEVAARRKISTKFVVGMVRSYELSWPGKRREAVTPEMTCAIKAFRSAYDGAGLRSVWWWELDQRRDASALQC